MGPMRIFATGEYFEGSPPISPTTVLGLMLAPPCASFSRERDRTGALRSRDRPWGLPNLPDADALRVAEGNACLRAALRAARTADKHRVPWILENPASSRMWDIMELCRIAEGGHVREVTADFCRFSTLWRKSTPFLLGNLDGISSGRLDQSCGGTRSTCGVTGKPHFQLSGTNKKGIPWTRVAQPYPKELCRSLAFMLTETSRAEFYYVLLFDGRNFAFYMYPPTSPSDNISPFRDDLGILSCFGTSAV